MDVSAGAGAQPWFLVTWCCGQFGRKDMKGWLIQHTWGSTSILGGHCYLTRPTNRLSHRPSSFELGSSWSNEQCTKNAPLAAPWKTWK